MDAPADILMENYAVNSPVIRLKQKKTSRKRKSTVVSENDKVFNQV